MYEEILVPTDGSEGSRRAVEEAAELAAAFDAVLHVLYVVDTRALPMDVDTGEILGELETEGKQAIDDVVDAAHDAGVGTTEAVVGRGTPHRAILDYSDQHDVDLVVMGTHGRTGVGRFLLGSVTEKVVRASDVPVLTVRMSGEGTTGAESNGE
ncbi:universal stress protein [Halomicrococcus gelatinilyticus]|uniref:universal stress protein n=1 Tax=Halomicrococcus gelatinilyticus TaxID=1702103 RepID=UPI002E151B54